MSTSEPTRITCELTGVEITPCDLDQLLVWAGSYLRGDDKKIIVGHNLHSAYLYHSDPVFAELYGAASIILCDGAPILIDAKISLRRASLKFQAKRLGSTDWLPSLLGRELEGKVAVIGAKPHVNGSFVESFLGHVPMHRVLGIPGQGWDQELENEIVEKLRKFRPNLVIIGLGMPIQERFMRINMEALPNALYVLVGGAIDQLVGEQILAPRWLGAIGLEWLWRLGSQPRRLGGRYLVEPWKLVALRIRQLLTR